MSTQEVRAEALDQIFGGQLTHLPINLAASGIQEGLTLNASPSYIGALGCAIVLVPRARIELATPQFSDGGEPVRGISWRII